jgi:ribonucleotide reductase alpha subunit
MTMRETSPANGSSSRAFLDLDQAGISVPTRIVKRDGRVVSFDIARIENAMARCFASFHRTPQVRIPDLARHVVNILAAKANGSSPTVEDVQDIVEMVLQAAGEFEAAKRYILYRAERARERERRPIPDAVRHAFAASDQYFPTALQKFQFFDKYSRFNYDLGRRETWIETVDRTVGYLHELAGDRLPAATYERIRRAILEMRAMPSMRLLAMAGAAARRNNITLYNCSYQPVESIDSFVEALIISMSGCGVGYSVESHYVENFPRVKRPTGLMRDTFVVPDSAEGWAEALRIGLETWFEGGDIRFDLAQLRQAGAPLRTKGGRASGPEPLRMMLEFVRSRVLARAGSFLRPIDAHDMMCAVGNAAVSGGMRRTAMLALFDHDDDEMRLCKSGDFERENSQRWNANNSAVWPRGGFTQQEFIHQFMEMVESGRGEPGIFNREAANAMKPARRQEADFGTNPCITGDTWVAVADGRGRARMQDLVAEGRDVAVYTVKDGELAIRMLRNPRKTGTQVPIYRVTFADGTSIRVTPNHTFLLTDGTEKTAVDLQFNDALTSLTVYSYQKKSLPQTAKVSYDAPGSYRMLQFGEYRKSEHRFIYQHHYDVDLTGIDSHIHHRDFDGRNNAIDNLEYVTATEHAQLHRTRMLGANNPVHQMTDAWRHNLSLACSGLVNGNAKQVTNEELEEHIITLVRSLGTIPSYSEYAAYARKHDLPLAFSQYRRQYFGGHIQHALCTIAERIGVVPRYVAEARKVTDLPVVFRDGRTYVVKTCEVCGHTFEVRLSRREQAVCGYGCSMKLQHQTLDREQFRQRLLTAHEQRRAELRTQQIRIYNDLMVELGRHPMKQEWQQRCKACGVSAEISRNSSPFRYWRDLQEQAAAANHRVVRVEADGYEDVYTGTVDETHTFFAIGTEQVDKRGRAVMRYVLNRQCGEILLRPWEFCNLTAAVARTDDTIESLREKVEVATIIGTIQSLATYFPGLRPMWQQNCDEERLLGVDITGQMDSPVAQDAQVKAELLQVAVGVNRETAAALGINQSAAITCVKPSGNSSQLLNCSSGLHARWAPYYVRNVRVATYSPLFHVLRSAGVPMDPENGQTPDNANTWVIHFPVKAPENAITRQDRSAIQQCEFWLQNKLYWTEHNPSATITYRPDEVLDLMKWVWEHRDQIGGLTFLPAFDANYAQMPYVEISQAEYERRVAAFPAIDFSKIYRYEEEDLTTAAQELACSAGMCETDF